MKKLVSYCFIVPLFLFLAPEFAIAQKSEIGKILHDFNHRPRNILVTAHRAAHLDHPENSIAAIRSAIEMGADIVEIDVRSTKDSVLVLMHDKTILRTTGDSGLVSDFTYAELRGKRLLQNGKRTSETIPTLKEALETAKGHIMVDIDFKLDSVSQAMSIYKLIEETGTEDQVIFYIYNQYTFIPFLQQVNPKVRVMPRAYNREDIRTILKNYKVSLIHIDDSFYDKKLMRKVRKKGIRIWSNALGKYDRMEKENAGAGYDAMLKMSAINIIQTDYPEALIQYLQKRKKHR